jgi:hypothetical protein
VPNNVRTGFEQQCTTICRAGERGGEAFPDDIWLEEPHER